MTEVLIGIQARSTSTRLPGKALELIENITVIEHVIFACGMAASFINGNAEKTGVHATVALLIPKGDILKEKLHGHKIIEGPEDDVLSRYYIAAKEFNSDYIVRITGDCPLMIPAMIGKHVSCAIDKKLDYVSNVDLDLRTYIDGLDCEVMSRRAMEWLYTTAKEKEEREHVSLRFRTHTPTWATVGAVIGHIDLSEIKLSVDTREELDRIRANKEAIARKLNLAKMRGYYVFRF